MVNCQAGKKEEEARQSRSLLDTDDNLIGDPVTIIDGTRCQFHQHFMLEFFV